MRCWRSARRAATSSRSTARSPNSTFAEKFRDAIPDRYFEMYIAEQQMVATAVGMQVLGWRPFASTFAAFLSRAYDFVRMSAISRAKLLPLRLARGHLDRRGRAVADGARGHRLDPRRPRLDRPAPVRREPDREARREDGRPRRHLLHPHAARRRRRSIYGPDEEFEIGGSRTIREGDDVAIVGRGDDGATRR